MSNTLNQNTYIELISPIKQEAIFWQNKASKITEVKDELTHRQSAELRKTLTTFINSSEKQRKNITKPILDFKKQIDNLAKDSLEPAIQAKQDLTQKITKYENYLAELERKEKQRIAKIKQPFLVADLKPTLELNKEMLKKVQVYFTNLEKKDQKNPEILEACNSLCERIKAKIHLQIEEKKQKEEAERLAKIKETQNKKALELAKKQAEIDKQKREQLLEKQRLEDEARKAEIQRQKALQEAQKKTTRVKTGLREYTTFEIVDEALIPREFCEPSTKLINAGIKKGKEIPGIKIVKIKK